MEKKIKKLIIFEAIAFIFIVPFILLGSYIDNILIPKIDILILLGIFVLVFLGWYIWFEKI